MAVGGDASRGPHPQSSLASPLQHDHSISTREKVRVKLVSVLKLHLRDAGFIALLCGLLLFLYFGTTHQVKTGISELGAANEVWILFLMGCGRGLLAVWLPAALGTNHAFNQARRRRARGGVGAKPARGLGVKIAPEGVKVLQKERVPVVGTRNEQNSAIPRTIPPDRDLLESCSFPDRLSECLKNSASETPTPVRDELRAQHASRTHKNRHAARPLADTLSPIPLLLYHSIFNALAFGGFAILVKYFYLYVERLFGPSQHPETKKMHFDVIFYKTMFDELVSAPIVWVPLYQFLVMFRNNTPFFFPTFMREEKIFSAEQLLTGWWLPGWCGDICVWTPCLLVIYPLPINLQAPMAAILGTFNLIIQTAVAGGEDSPLEETVGGGSGVALIEGESFSLIDAEGAEGEEGEC